MKIGFVLDDTLDTDDGVQQYVRGIGMRLAREGHEVHYLVGQTKRRDIKHIHSLSKNLHVGFNKNKMSTPLLASKQKIKRLLKNEKFDVLHIQMPYSPMLGGRVIAAADGCGTPVVATFHILPASAFESLSLKLLLKIQRRSLQKLTTVLAVSGPAKKCLEDLADLDVSVVPNPVDVDRYQSKAKLISASAQISLIFLGRLVERKGCQEFLKALQWLHVRHGLDNVSVKICGDGPQRRKLMTYTKLHKLDSYVEFLGYVTEEEKVSQLHASDIAVFPSLGGESFGIVLIEAMAAGVATVLAGDNPGYRYVMDGREQQLFDPGNTPVFAAQILHFIRNEHQRTVSKKWQQKRVRDFSLDKVSAKLITVYGEAIAKKRKD